jgi:hypothetical protein
MNRKLEKKKEKEMTNYEHGYVSMKYATRYWTASRCVAKWKRLRYIALRYSTAFALCDVKYSLNETAFREQFLLSLGIPQPHFPPHFI